MAGEGAIRRDPRSILKPRRGPSVAGLMPSLERGRGRTGGLGVIGGRGRVTGEIVSMPEFTGTATGSSNISSPVVNLSRTGLWSINLTIAAAFDDSAFDPDTAEPRYRQCQCRLYVERGTLTTTTTTTTTGRHEGGSYDSKNVPSAVFSTTARITGNGGLFYGGFLLGGSTGGWTWTYWMNGYAEWLAP